MPGAPAFRGADAGGDGGGPAEADAILNAARPPQAILFDLDDTLYDREAAFRQWAAVLLAEVLGLTGGGHAEALRWLAAQDADGYGSKLWALQRLAARYPQALPSPDDPQRLYDEFLEGITLDGSATRVLDRLDAGGVPYGIVTNGTERQHRKIARLGLDRRTDCLFVSDTFGRSKPDPAIFLAAADCLGVAPKDVLFVGDHPINDIRGAQGAGMRAAWLPRGKPWPDALQGARPDFVLERLTDLLPSLA